MTDVDTREVDPESVRYAESQQKIANVAFGGNREKFMSWRDKLIQSAQQEGRGGAEEVRDTINNIAALDDAELASKVKIDMKGGVLSRLEDN